ncbi:TPA: phosphoribosylamine--glycine ligase, partial [Candidatus Woesearchaeota archaeon]|nr:phosphoribosylamine--glycine ligase [Candidatus Woesearchaeota archaeon]
MNKKENQELNILLIGNGAREHAIAEAIKRSKHSIKLFAYMKSKNPGIVKLADGYVLGKYDDFDEIKSYCTLTNINFAVIGPENPLELGIVDALEEIGVKSVGPKKVLAQLETSKSFTRNLLTKYKIPGNPLFKVFPTKNGLYDFIKSLNGNKNDCKNDASNNYGFVIKADGLMGGKGVKVSGDHLNTVQDGVNYAEECIINDSRVVVEEKFIGQEFSLMCFCDGKTVVGMPAVQDHKRAFEDDQGPNTGGM